MSNSQIETLIFTTDFKYTRIMDLFSCLQVKHHEEDALHRKEKHELTRRFTLVCNQVNIQIDFSHLMQNGGVSKTISFRNNLEEIVQNIAKKKISL